MGYYFVVARCSLSISARHKRLSAIMPAAIPDAAEYTLKTSIMIAVKSDTAANEPDIFCDKPLSCRPHIPFLSVQE